MGSIYSVAKINAYIKHMFDEDFALANISVSGEVSNCKYHSSGHIYFTLKEENSVLSCVMFASNAYKLNFKLKEGQKVIVTGNISVYERDGKYQMYARSIAMDGEGDLFKKFEQLKQELLEMGMFEKEYKKPLPKYAMKIGIVTASTGAAIQDIINISKRRNPYVSLYLYSAIVQGSEAVRSICNGISVLDEMDLDVIIVGRGGGSIEDLWAFNEEAVARAIFACNTPIISAVGHETDTTIADYVADLRAPTPSAAAELAVFSYDDFLMDLESISYSLQKEMKVKLDSHKLKLKELDARLKAKSPKNQIELKKQHIKDIENCMRAAMEKKMADTKNRFFIMAEKLNGMSPLTKLNSGYSYVSKDSAVVKSIEDVKKGDKLKITVIDGYIAATINEIEKEEKFKDIDLGE